MHEQPSEHAMFERLSATFDDPYIDRMKAKALEVEELLNSTDFTIDERAALVKSLDDEWIYRHHTVFVTGEMWCVSPERRVPERRRVTGLEVQSDGFMFDPTRLELGDEFFEGRQNAAFAFKIDTGREDGKYSYAAMHFDDVTHIEYPFPSHELRVQRFLYHFPNHAHDVDCAVFSASDVSELVRDVARSVQFTANISDPLETENILDFQAYLTEMLVFDTELPYRVQIMGEVAVLNDDDDKTAKVPSVIRPIKRFASMHQVRLLPDDLSGDSVGGSKRYVAYAEMTLHDVRQGVNPKHVLIPFSSLLYMENVRDEL